MKAQRNRPQRFGHYLVNEVLLQTIGEFHSVN